MLMGGLILAEEGRSYELHGEQVAAELCARRRGGSREAWARRRGLRAA